MTNDSKKNIQTPVTILVFLLFAFCVVSVILSGAGVYKRVVSSDNDAFARRTAEQYIKTKIRSAVSPDSVCLTQSESGNVLCLRETINGKAYATYIGCSGGQMRELFTAETEGILSDEQLLSGEPLLEMESITFEKSGNLLTVSYQLPGKESRTFSVSAGGRAS